MCTALTSATLQLWRETLVICCSNQCRVMLGLKSLSERCEKSCIFCESAGASARKLTVSGKQSVKSDTHLYAELFTRSKTFSNATVAACDRLKIAVTSLLSLCQASPDVDEEGFSLRPGEEVDDILSVKSRSRSSSSLGTLLLQTIDLFG